MSDESLRTDPPAAATPADPPAFSDDGVDLTLVRWMLSLTPAERLEVLRRHVESILSIRHANERR